MQEVKDRESQGRGQKAQLYFLFTQALFKEQGLHSSTLLYLC